MRQIGRSSALTAKPTKTMAVEIEMKIMESAAPRTTTVTEAEEMVAAALGGSIADAESYINQVLYGSNTERRGRLPVFEVICPTEQ